jgi:hypothetical protein
LDLVGSYSGQFRSVDGTLLSSGTFTINADRSVRSLADFAIADPGRQDVPESFNLVLLENSQLSGEIVSGIKIAREVLNGKVNKTPSGVRSDIVLKTSPTTSSTVFLTATRI